MRWCWKDVSRRRREMVILEMSTKKSKWPKTCRRHGRYVRKAHLERSFVLNSVQNAEHKILKLADRFNHSPKELTTLQRRLLSRVDLIQHPSCLPTQTLKMTKTTMMDFGRSRLGPKVRYDIEKYRKKGSQKKVSSTPSMARMPSMDWENMDRKLWLH